MGENASWLALGGCTVQNTVDKQFNFAAQKNSYTIDIRASRPVLASDAGDSLVSTLTLRVTDSSGKVVAGFTPALQVIATELQTSGKSAILFPPRL